jgi:hypothetical protein
MEEKRMHPTNNRAAIEDFMRRYGYEEKEVEAAYYLRQARDRFTEIYEDEVGPRSSLNLSAEMFLQINVDPHFNALWGLLSRRVLEQPYPEGRGFRPTSDEGEGEQPD